MKKTLLIPLVICMLWITPLVSAQMIDKPVATVRLIKTEAITVKQFEKAVDSLQQLSQKPFTQDEKKQILDEMINEKLIIQAAMRDGISISSQEINAKLAEAKRTVEMQLKRQITQAQFEEVLKSQLGVSLDKVEESVKSQLLAQKYLQARQQKYLAQLKEPTDQEIKAFYEENIKQFKTPEMVRIKQILVYAKDLPSEIDNLYKNRINDISKDIQKGASFDDYWKVYIDGATDAIGELNMDVWQKTDKNKEITYGEKFFNDVFSLKQGSISKVLKSNIGYHIIQVLESMPAKALALDEKVPPKYTVTVREQVAKLLFSRAQMELSQKAMAEIVDEIKKTAVIKVFDENLQG